MTTIFHEDDADLAALAGQRVAVVGYGNQGRSWALNLRDSGLDVRSACVRRDATRRAGRSRRLRRPATSRRRTTPTSSASSCPTTSSRRCRCTRRPTRCTIVASGYTLAFDRLRPAGDVGMVAPRMLGPEVRRCYEEGVGFITAVGVHRDATGRAQARTLAVAKAIGGLRQGAHRADADAGGGARPRRRAGAVARAHRASTTRSCGTMLEHGIPLEAIVTELVLSGEVERTYRLLREVGYAAQSEFHSPTSQYGQLVAPRALRPPRRRARRCASSSTTSRRAASPTSGTPSATPATRSLDRAEGAARRPRRPRVRSRPPPPPRSQGTTAGAGPNGRNLTPEGCSFSTG